MSSPDDSERSDDAPKSDYAPKWARDRDRQANPDRAKGEPPHLTFLRSLEQFPERAQSLDPETVGSPQPLPRRLGWFAISGGFVIAAVLGAIIGLLATVETPVFRLRQRFCNQVTRHRHV